MVQFLPLPAIAYPQNAMINFQPINQALQFAANNQLERGRFGLQQAADLRAQEMHPLAMDYQRAQTGLVGAQTEASRGAETRANQMQPLIMDQTRAQTGLTRANIGQVGAQTQMTNLQVANERENQAQRLALLFSQAQTPEQHAALLSSLQARRVPIPQQLSTFQGAQAAAATLAGPAYTQHQTQMAQLNRLDPLREVDIRAQMAQRYGLMQGMPGYAQYVLGGQAPAGQTLDSTSRRQIIESDQAVQAGAGVIDSLTEALRLSAIAYDGPTAAGRAAVLGPMGNRSAQATQQFQQIMTAQALAQLKQLFGAAPSDAEGRLLREIQGAATQPQAVRDAIIRRAIAAAEASIRFHRERAASLRGGGYFQPGYQGAATPGVSVQQPSGQGVQTTTADQINATQVGQVVTINGRRFRRAADGGFNPE